MKQLFNLKQKWDFFSSQTKKSIYNNYKAIATNTNTTILLNNKKSFLVTWS